MATGLYSNNNMTRNGIDTISVTCPSKCMGRKRMYDYFVEKISSGQLPPNTPLANTATLAKQFNISPMSAQRTLAELSQAGYLVRRPGRRTLTADLKKPRFSLPQHNNTIGVMLPTMGAGLNIQESPGNFQYVQGIVSTADSKRMHVSILSGAGKQLQPNALLKMRLRGIICVLPRLTDLEYLQRIQETGIPLVLINPRPPDCYNDFSRVEDDFKTAGRLAFEYFQHKGCKNMALMTGTNVYWDSHQYILLRGFAAAAAEAGMHAGVIELYYKKARHENALASLDTIREWVEKYDALLCAEKVVADVIHQQYPGLQLIGFDNSLRGQTQGQALPYPYFQFNIGECTETATELLLSIPFGERTTAIKTNMLTVKLMT